MRIQLYQLQEPVNPEDKLLGTRSSSDDATRNYSIGDIAGFAAGMLGSAGIFRFSDGSNEEITPATPGYFFSEDNIIDPATITSLFLNPVNSQVQDISELLDLVGDNTDAFIFKLVAISDPNNIIYYRIDSLTFDAFGYYIVEVDLYSSGLFNGELIDLTQYSFEFYLVAESEPITFGSGLRNDGGIIKLGSDPNDVGSGGELTEDTLIIRANNPAIASTSILHSDEYNEDGDPVVTTIQTIVFDGEDAYSSYVNSQISDQDGNITPEANVIVTTPEGSKGIMVTTSLNGLVVSDGLDGQGLVGEEYFGDNATDNSYIQRKYVDDNLINGAKMIQVIASGGAIQSDDLIGMTGIRFIIGNNTAYTENTFVLNSGTGQVTGLPISNGKKYNIFYY